MDRVLLINGPNLNLLGLREPEVYGTTSLSELEETVRSWGRELALDVETVQSNHEGAIIDALNAARGTFDGIVINPAAFSHYSYAIHDAIVASDLPAVEIHISNIHAREPWRRTTVTGAACDHVIFGRGLRGYRDALVRLVNSAALPPVSYHYGSAADQVAELRVPPGNGPHPVAVLIHGGFWRDVWTLDLMDNLAIDLVGRGWAAWNVEYRRVGGGGGWPITLQDVAGAIDALTDVASDHSLDTSRMTFIGHSSGAQLAAWATKRTHLHTEQAARPPTMAPATVVLLAGVTDLASAHRLGLGNNAVEDLLRRTPDDGKDRYAAASPIAFLPLGVDQVVAHGSNDAIVPADMSAEYAAAAKNAGDDVKLLTIDDTDHFDVIDPAGPAWAEIASQFA